MVEAEAANPVRLPIYSTARESLGEVELSRQVFDREGKTYVVHEAVRMQLANRRAGTAATKTRGLVSGGGRKPWRQKGTGNARAGSTRSPLWRHGGTIFGPQPRDYSYRMPKKAWNKALCLVLSERARGGKIIIVDKLEVLEPKTRIALALLEKLGLKHALILLGEGEEQFGRAARNLAAHKVLSRQGLNVYDLLNYDELLMSATVVREIDRHLAGIADG